MTMNSKTEDIIWELKGIHEKATSMREDGWTQNYYREKLLQIKEFINNIPQEDIKLHEVN